MNIPFSPPDITDLEIDEVLSTLKSGWITTGPKTKLFERKIAEYCGTPRAVCLNSATAAMEMTLYLLGVGPGDEVITSAYTYTASASVIHHIGAKIVLVDTAPGSYEMDYEKLRTAITPRTKAIIPVDLGGVMCNYDTIFEVAESRKSLYKPETDMQKHFDRCVIVADAAHSFGAEFKGKRAGAVADFTCFSFHAVKNLTTAEGGAVTWLPRPNMDNDEIYRQFMLLSLHGQSKDALSKMSLGSWEYDIIYPAYKCNMTDITAAMGLAQIARFEALLHARKRVYDRYMEAFSTLGLDCLNHETKDYLGNYHLFMVRLPQENEQQRNRVIAEMAEKGVACNVHFKPLPMHTAYKKLGFDIKDYPNAYAQYCNEVTLPSHTLLSDEDIDYVISTFKDVLTSCSVKQPLLLDNLEFVRVWENDTDATRYIHEIIKESGEEMFLREGLMHWATPISMQIIKEEVLAGEFYLVRQKDAKKPIAVFSITNKPSPYFDINKKALYLHRIAVVPHLWRKGVGTAIFNWAKQRAAQAGIDVIRSSVYSEDPVAVAFLKSLGYQTLYQRPTKNFIVDCMEAEINL